MAQQQITPGFWGDERTKINEMFSEIYNEIKIRANFIELIPYRIIYEVPYRITSVSGISVSITYTSNGNPYTLGNIVSANEELTITPLSLGLAVINGNLE